MTTILAIDAAWTVHQPSGVALLQRVADRWRCIAVAPSYADFDRLARGLAVDWSSPVLRGTAPSAGALLDAAHRLAGSGVDLVVMDMPLAATPITGRRYADSAVSRAFGGRGCATHSPSSAGPGPLGDRLREDFAALGYPLAVANTPVGSLPRIAEVYPHPALLALLSVERRVPYKLAKAARYWPEATALQRQARVVDEWRNIARALAMKMHVEPFLPRPGWCGPSSQLKRFEDALDAVVCGWIGAEYVEGRAQPFGDETAAIWVPKMAFDI